MTLVSLQPDEYAAYIKNAPEIPLWQSLEWKHYQESLGRQTRLYSQKDTSGGIQASALVIVDRTAFGLSTWDIPRGPLGASPEAISCLIEGIVAEARKERCLAAYFSPGYRVSGTRYRVSGRHEQPEATIALDLTLSDESLLKQMRQKGRYNIRLAEKHGVTVHESQNIDVFYDLLKKTGRRDRFEIKPKGHYEKFLHDVSESFLLLAKVNNKFIGGLLGVTWRTSGIYYYGASSFEDRAVMAPYLLQWEAIRLCKRRGCTEYDLLGIVPEIAAVNHPWRGITRFKRQFGGNTVTYAPEQEIDLRPVVKKLLEWKRKYF